MTAGRPKLVAILAAGRGTRVTAWGGALHKALLPLGEIPVITRVIRQFPERTRFVVAVGHLATQVTEYLHLAHPDLDVTVVPVDPFDGPGSGPGRSIWECRAHLDRPFVLTACDAICTKSVPEPSDDWMGAHLIDDPEHWCTLELDDTGAVTRLRYKDASGPPTAFIGVAGIVHPDVFFAGLATSLETTGEVQVDAGFEALAAHGPVRTVELGWLDTGTDETFASTRAALGVTRDLTFAGKATDVTYRIDDRIVKVFFHHGRADRQARRLRDQPAGPELLGAASQAIAYRYVEGPLFDERTDAASVERFLDWAQRSLWVRGAHDDAFVGSCREFYLTKTRGRLAAYLERTGRDAEPPRLVINGRTTASIAEHLARLDDGGDGGTGFLDGGTASSFHGDLHGGNVICSADGYRLIDWREDFGGSLEVGDRYYDLAKFLHTLELSVAVMEERSFTLALPEPGAGASSGDSGDACTLRLPPDDVLLGARQAFWRWAGPRYDARRIAIVDALIFVNMAPLYDEPLQGFLYHLGRLLLDASSDPGMEPSEIFDRSVEG